MYIVVKGYCFYSFNVSNLKNIILEGSAIAQQAKDNLVKEQIISSFKDYTNVSLGAFCKLQSFQLEYLKSDKEDGSNITVKALIKALFYKIEPKQIVTFEVQQVHSLGLIGKLYGYEIDCPINLLSSTSSTYNESSNTITVDSKKIKEKDILRGKVSSVKDYIKNSDRCLRATVNCRSTYLGKI